ncbi:tRNA lysidine(34) synthetase TilS [Oceanospirillum linum]|uniref:tRNA(Ile)-lysidine synthase n=1 Tax=Oceanospirillum linum TaxID=966 RepID=A0A1T1HFW4_OCELI|nr:tRNA lysidine(34) synthetase TilS [Oceanospirillum linum]OOV88630.1 tRNA lysidine(34) synthetase TilS [Oceanospirillum linum]SEG04846.1 tRNA(Ile)-lysidine synthase [Oleiphilus messinensis]SMP20897.1 tRNA(Ile)-lysidine synthase [Oceanospirillum linum]
MKSDVITSDLLQNLPPHKQLWLALSGGLDSVVLLDLTVQYCASRQKSLKVIHVHHGLSPNADQWAEHCLSVCQCYQERLVVQEKHSVQEGLSVSVHCQVEHVQLNGISSIEEQARKARYQVFKDHLVEGDLILMAHHADDQLETLLLRLMRGAGALGLSGMPVERELGQGRLYRPLLAFERSELEAYAAENALSWVEDESNLGVEFDRNYLRHEITPRLKSRWPNATKVAGRSARVLSDADQLNRDLAEIDLKSVAASANALSCPALLELSPARQRNLLRFWLQNAGIPSPDYRQIMIILDELVLAQNDAQPLFQRPQYALRRYRDQLLLQLTNTEASDDGHALYDTEPVSICRDVVEAGGADLVKEAVAFRIEPFHVEACLPESESGSESVKDAEVLQLPLSSSVVLESRKGGESLRLPRRGGKALKKLLQETGVPAWLRDQVRLFWLETQEGERQLIGAWSPQVDKAGIFWWDISMLEADDKCDTYPVVIRRK